MIVSEIKSIAATLGMSFKYGNAFEVNQNIDQSIKYPLLVYYAPVTTDDAIEDNGLVNSKFPFTAMVLTRVEASTIEYDSEELQDTIDSMRDLARKFIYNLNNDAVINQIEGGIKEVTYDTVYSEFDSHLFGVAIKATVPVSTGSTYC